MKYLVQSREHNYYPLTREEWSSEGWNYTTTKEYDTVEKAVHRVRNDSNLARWIWPLRVMTSEGEFVMGYDPELDTRLPGVRHRIIERNAYKLWEDAGCLVSDGKEFWYKSEAELNECDGLVFRFWQ